jgi:hypothetical protein
VPHKVRNRPSEKGLGGKTTCFFSRKTTVWPQQQKEKEGEWGRKSTTQVSEDLKAIFPTGKRKN